MRRDKTWPRPTILNDLEPENAAAAVSQFLGFPQRSGPWVIEHFTVDQMGELISAMRGSESGGRRVPMGDYIYLRNTDFDWNHQPINKDEDPVGYTMMSNTPDEISDHAVPFDHAEGNVLITGLGLSCVVSGLLAKPEVDHIDVVEFSEDVIAMVGPAYANEPRVTIHQGDAMSWPIPPNARWDFAWHDIWARISDDNLDTATAENGISYEAMFRRYAPYADFQDAWAFGLALNMRQAEYLAEDYREAFGKMWRNVTPEQRIDMLIEFQTSGPFQPPIEATKQLLKQTGDYDKMAKRCQDDEPPSIFVPASRFLMDAKMYELQNIEEALENYGLSADEYGRVVSFA